MSRNINTSSILGESRDSSVGMATGYGLDYRMIGDRFPAGAGNFSFRHRVQTDSYSVVTEGSFPGGKVSGA
jgi:hypothetical protein